MKRPDAVTALAAGAALVTITLTGTAFWLSYEHLHDIADVNGLSGPRAWAWPATIDLFIVAGELLVLRASLRGAVDWWAIALAALGSLGSIALNVAGVGAHASVLEYVVAAIPPTAALIAFGALMRQVHEALRRIPATPQPIAATFEEAAAEAIETALPPLPQRPAHPPLSAADCASAADQRPAAVAELHAPDTDAELHAAALALNAAALADTGRPASLRQLQTELRIGQRRAQRIQAQLPRSA
ncbi:DUF2637 domain-containing protein [Streptomyces sp. NPDC023838]|uniref:DUF2637 domain-containing protein n=1 Tax=Streptomyces sp. NPDC023838 TaxID=3154325 RepID=UPI0033FA6E12